MATTTDRMVQRQILRLALTQLGSMLMLATTMKMQRYLIRRSTSGFRDFEAEVSELPDQRAIHGTGILATRTKIAIAKPSWEDDFYLDEVPLGSHELGAYIDSFPLEAAGASYAFTLLEVFGDDVAALVGPGTLQSNKAWHEGIRGDAVLKDRNQMEACRKAFAKHFSADSADVPDLAVSRMVDLKRVRNEFAHAGSNRIDFKRYLHDVCAVVCHIVFLTTDEDRVSVYPWEDHLDQFDPLTKA